MLIVMATLQRTIISLLIVLTAAFLFFAQTSEAAKGPKITHKVDQVTFMFETFEAKRLLSRCTLTLNMATSLSDGLSWDSTERRLQRLVSCSASSLPMLNTEQTAENFRYYSNSSVSSQLRLTGIVLLLLARRDSDMRDLPFTA